MVLKELSVAEAREAILAAEGAASEVEGQRLAHHHAHPLGAAA